MARIRIEPLPRPSEEELGAGQASHVVGAGPFYYGPGYPVGYPIGGFGATVVTPYGGFYQPGFSTYSVTTPWGLGYTLYGSPTVVVGGGYYAPYGPFGRRW